MIPLSERNSNQKMQWKMEKVKGYWGVSHLGTIKICHDNLLKEDKWRFCPSSFPPHALRCVPDVKKKLFSRISCLFHSHQSANRNKSVRIPEHAKPETDGRRRLFARKALPVSFVPEYSVTGVKFSPPTQISVRNRLWGWTHPNHQISVKP